VGVISNSNGSVRLALERAGLAAHLDFVIDSDRAQCGGPGAGTLRPGRSGGRRGRRVASGASSDDEFTRAAARGLEAPPGEYLLWIAARERYRAAWREFFREWDVLLAPAFSTLAYPHVERPFPSDESDFDLTLTINDQPAPYMRCIFYPSVATLAGQPATAFPVGRSREGLPIGLQAIGPYLEDRTPIRFAAFLAKEIGGFAKPEGYDA
jgi:amidase